MSHTIKEERLRWVLPIIHKKITLVDAAKVCPYGTRTLERWVSQYRKDKEEGLELKSTKPHTQPNETPITIKERIITLRKKTNLCALKLKWRLEKEGIFVHERTVGKILKQEGLTRTYRKKKVKYHYVRAKRKPGDLVEIDVKYVPGRVAGRRYYQYTAIDTASRWRYLAVYDGQSTYNSIRFLKEVIEQFPHPIVAIKTDNHSTFTNFYTGMNKRSDMTVKTIHSLDRFCAEYGIVHYLIDRGKPAQNGTVERSHREDQEKLYEKHTFGSFPDLRNMIKQWNSEYNNLEHCGLNGKTPNEALQDSLILNPPNVCA